MSNQAAIEKFSTVAVSIFGRPPYKYGVDKNQAVAKMTVKQSRYLYILAKNAGIKGNQGRAQDSYQTDKILVEVFDGGLFVTELKSYGPK